MGTFGNIPFPNRNIYTLCKCLELSKSQTGSDVRVQLES
jgi:hypothetical protein